MHDVGSFLWLSLAVFAGAFVSGFVGFAFSAVAGGILLHVLPPIAAVPLMMACSVGVQATNLWALRRNIQWKESLVLVLGGLAGADADPARSPSPRHGRGSIWPPSAASDGSAPLCSPHRNRSPSG